jgi:hypothetical protein
MKSCWKPTKEAFPGSLLMTSLLPLLPPQPPTFLSFSDVLAQGEVSGTGKKQEGLFTALVGDPKVIMADLLSHPSKYEEGVYDLLLELVAGRRSLQQLNENEQQLLDRAVVDFNSTEHAPAPPQPPKEAAKPELGEEREIEYHEPVATSVTEVPYWWT